MTAARGFVPHSLGQYWHFEVSPYLQLTLVSFALKFLDTLFYTGELFL